MVVCIIANAADGLSLSKVACISTVDCTATININSRLLEGGIGGVLRFEIGIGYTYCIFIFS